MLSFVNKTYSPVLLHHDGFRRAKERTLIKKLGQDLVVKSSRVYSLDRCFKCLNTLNLGEKCFAVVKLRKENRNENGESAG